MSNEKTATWTRQPLFDPAKIAKSTQISFKERLQLLFKKNEYAYEDGTLVRYKRLKGVTFILDISRYRKGEL